MTLQATLDSSFKVLLLREKRHTVLEVRNLFHCGESAIIQRLGPRDSYLATTQSPVRYRSWLTFCIQHLGNVEVFLSHLKGVVQIRHWIVLKDRKWPERYSGEVGGGGEPEQGACEPAREASEPTCLSAEGYLLWLRHRNVGSLE